MAITRKATELTHALLTATDIGVLRGDRVLLEKISLEAAAGTFLALRGDNGSGKTTLLRILAGLTHAESGSVERRAPYHWLGHQGGLKPHETPQRHLNHWARAWGHPVMETGAVLEKMRLSVAANVPARQLSAGQRRRTAIGRLLLNRRPLWLLDEPFEALDTHGDALMRDLMDDHLRQGGAIIAALHGKTGPPPTEELIL